MAQFHYTAKKGPQELVRGTVEAATLDEAVARVMDLGYAPLDVTGDGPSRVRRTRKEKSDAGALRVPALEIVSFTRELSNLIDAGVPVLRALRLIEKRVRQAAFKIVIEQLAAAVQDGKMLSTALGQFPRVFSPFYVNVVRAGEMGGNLGGALSQLAEFTETDHETRAQVRMSLIYPALILTVSVATIFVLFTWVIPRITVIFEDIGQTLPLLTRILLGISGFLSQFWWAIIVAVILAVIFVRRLVQTPAGRLWFDGLKLRVPVLGGFIRDVEVGRFSRTLGTLLESGVMIVTALEAVWKVMDNVVLRQEVQKISQEVSSGTSLAAAIKGCPLFTDTDGSMIAVGEEAGRLYLGLNKLAAYHEKQAQRFMKTMTTMIEPILILGLGTIVSFIVIGMLMPIFRMNLMIQ